MRTIIESSRKGFKNLNHAAETKIAIPDKTQSKTYEKVGIKVLEPWIC